MDGDERQEHPITSALIAAVVTAVPALAGLATGRLLLFPSLAPTAVMQASNPSHKSSRPYNIVVAHVTGLAAAFFSVTVLGIAHAPSIFTAHHLSSARVDAAVLAVAIGTAVELALRASHPPAASTTLLAALGSFHPTYRDTFTVVAGVLIVTAAGEIARRLRLALREDRQR